MPTCRNDIGSRKLKGKDKDKTTVIEIGTVIASIVIGSDLSNNPKNAGEADHARATSFPARVVQAGDRNNRAIATDHSLISCN